MYFRYIKLKFVGIKLWRWLLLVIFYFMIIFFDIKAHAGNYSLIEFIIRELNEYFNICYYFLFAIVIISSDIYDSSNEIFYNHFIIKMGRAKYIKANIIYTIILSLIILTIFIFIILVIYLITFKAIYIPNENNMMDLGLINLSWASGFLFSFSLILFRLIFLNSGVFLTNFKLNYPIGFLFPFFITIIDWWFYEIFQIMEPIFILPIEHSRIFYTEAVAPAVNNILRVSYGISYIYWLVLIGVELIFMTIFINKRDFS